MVARLLIPPGQRYDARKRDLAPFDRVVDLQHKMRDDVVKLAEACEKLGKVLLVIVNNKAEGSSPLTVRALAERLVARGRAVKSAGRATMPEPDPERYADAGALAERAREPAVADNVRFGTAGWTDKTLVASGSFYPKGAQSAEARLRHYAHALRPGRGRRDLLLASARPDGGALGRVDDARASSST